MSVAREPGALEVIWSRLNSIADEAALTLSRTSFSTVVRESKDLTCVVFDGQARSLAQAAESIPSFTGTLPLTLRHFLERYPAESWSDQDVVITNDPWLGTGHLPDICMAIPVFHSERLVAFIGLVAHMPDIGGKTLSATANEVFEEGLRIPVSRFHRAGVPNEDIIAFIAYNVRVPDEVLGDINAMISAGQVAKRRLLELMDEFGLTDLTDIAVEVQGRAEQAMRDQIRALPAGSYEHTIVTDGVGHPLTIKLTLRVIADRLELDYSGTSPQQEVGINSPWCYTYSYSVFAVKSVLCPEVPNNEGTFQPITVRAPDGSLLNPRFPAATGARSTTGHFVVAVVYGALARLVPDRVLAECGAPRPIVVIRGARDDGSRYSQTLFCMGSMGARPNQDGISCIAYPTNTSVTPVEVLEAGTPIRVIDKTILTDSGGPGRYRGGCGQRLKFEMLARAPVTISVRSDRTEHPAQGAAGGHPGSCTRIMLNGRLINPKGITMAQYGDVLQVETPGSGGYGHPLERDVNLVAQDIANGFVSPEAARSIYGVSLDPVSARPTRIGSVEDADDSTASRAR